MSEDTATMPIEDYLAQGGVLTSPANVPARYRGELLRLMATFVDSELAASAGFADTINDAPGITARIAACRITLEKADHAERVLALMGDFGADEGRYAVYHTWADRLPRDASLGQARHGGDMRLAVFHYPIEGWTDAVVLNVLQGLAAAVTLEEMAAGLLRPARRRRPRHRPAREAPHRPRHHRPHRPRRHRGRPRRGEGIDRLLAAPRRRQLRRHELRPVRDAEALRPPPPPERGAARRLDRFGAGDAGAPRPRLRRPPMSVEVTTKPRRLESYLAGQWVRGTGKGQTLLERRHRRPRRPDRLLRHRLRRRPRLRPRRRSARSSASSPSTTAPRCSRRSASSLWRNKEEFYAESLATGATRPDGWIDIEGGAGTLLSYASKARRELPNTRVLTDGDVEVLSKDSTFSAQHILTPLEGVAIHINAFNFPVWGMLEKVAPTFIAGVPSIVKPASQTAYLTELVVRRIVESGILPEGAIQLISGSVGDLLDHVTGQDVVTFTGSAWTGRKLQVAPGDRRELRPLHHGGRQPQRLDPRPRRRPRHAGVRPLRQGSRPRDDREGRPEVHRHPPRHRPARLH